MLTQIHFSVWKCLSSRSIGQTWEWLCKALCPTREWLWWLQPLAHQVPWPWQTEVIFRTHSKEYQRLVLFLCLSIRCREGSEKNLSWCNFIIFFLELDTSYVVWVACLQLSSLQTAESISVEQHFPDSFSLNQPICSLSPASRSNFAVPIAIFWEFFFWLGLA